MKVRCKALDDKIILALLEKEPESALEEVMRLYTRLVTHIVRGSLIPPFSEEDVDECVSDTFLRFYNKGRYIDTEKGSIKAWLCTVAKNRATDFRRSNPYGQIAIGLDEALTEDDERSFCSEDTLAKKEQMDSLAAAIASLDAADREIVVRKYYYLEKTKDIAAYLGMSPNAVDIRAHRALKKLKNILGGDFLEG